MTVSLWVWCDLRLSTPPYDPWRVSCMTPGSRPVTEVSACCWYHSVDRHQASRLARRLVRRALLAVSGDEVVTSAIRAVPRRMPKRVAEGVGSLVLYPIDATAEQITNGGHRITAMRAQAVTVTLGIRYGLAGDDWSKVEGVYSGRDTGTSIPPRLP